MHSINNTCVPAVDVVGAAFCFYRVRGRATMRQESTDAEKKVAALDAMLRRICTPKPKSGKLEVSDEIHQQWKKGGSARKELLDVLVKCDGDRVPRQEFNFCECGACVSVGPSVQYKISLP